MTAWKWTTWTMTQKATVASGMRMIHGTGTSGVVTGCMEALTPSERAKVEKAREAKETKAKAKEESPVSITTTGLTEAHTREIRAKARERARIATNVDTTGM